MQRKAVAVVAVGAILAAAAGARWMAQENGAAAEVVPAGGAAAAFSPSTFDHSLPLEERIRALEQAVSDERYARQLLQDELFVLTAELETRGASRPADDATDRSASLEPIEAAPAASRRRPRAEGRAAQLVAAGFEAGQAEWILQRESQLQMEALQARYEAERTGDATDYFRSRTAASDALRSELGDTEYERYLAASGLPTGISVSTVLDSSPAQSAGLRPGDEIVRYDGARIFSMSDLNRQTLQGQPGDQVAVDILRDGVAMQVVLPRGPIGISGGRRFSRQGSAQ